MENDIEKLIAYLLAHRSLLRIDSLAKRVLTDELFREEVERRLAGCGLELLDNPYADSLAVGLKRSVEDAVFGQPSGWLSNNASLPRDAVALLVVLWGLLILPKRQRQRDRQPTSDAPGQAQIFADERVIPRGAEASVALSERTLLADFGERLGKKNRMQRNLSVLARLGFIIRRGEMIQEGPLLDLLIDYSVLAPRLIEGALADLLRPNALAEPPRTGEKG